MPSPLALRPRTAALWTGGGTFVLLTLVLGTALATGPTPVAPSDLAVAGALAVGVPSVDGRLKATADGLVFDGLVGSVRQATPWDAVARVTAPFPSGLRVRRLDGTETTFLVGRRAAWLDALRALDVPVG